jgi:hypothetical protein
VDERKEPLTLSPEHRGEGKRKSPPPGIPEEGKKANAGRGDKWEAMPVAGALIELSLLCSQWLWF